MRSEDGRMYDVAILGTGIGGTLLGAILAANGLDVLLLEQGVHPRFTIGESTIPETTVLLRLMARRYGVPEIAHLSNFHSTRAHVSAACGVKRNFSFHHHRPGEPNDPRHTNQFLTWAPPFGPDIHFFRQDTDAYMLAVAARRGAKVRQQTEVKEIRFDDAGVDLATATGESFRARYVVDAGGMRAPIAQMFGLREEPCPLRTRSRTIFTHMVGVTPYDRCAPPRREHGLPSPLAQGTLHHIFEGGWIWVIPFDNHPTSTNRLCSVGLTLDLSRHPEPEGAPEEEVQRWIARFPTVARHFEAARAIRPWTATRGLQYSSSQIAGDRFCLLPHAAAFVDPLFSSGLAVTMAAINGMAARLIAAKTDGDLSGERFRSVETWTRRLFDYYDRLVSGAYVSFRDFALWNAWHRLWMLGSLYGAAGLFEILGRHDRGGGPAVFERFEMAPYRGLQAIDFEPLQELFDAAEREIAAVRSAERAPVDAAACIFELLAESGLCPAPWRLTDPAHRWAGTLTLIPTVRLVAWGRYRSPAAVRRHYFVVGRSGGLLGDLRRLWVSELRRGSATAAGVLRDALKSWNHDWRRSGGATAAGAPPFHQPGEAGGLGEAEPVATGTGGGA
jgi:FADH2 O2-dependent halogenase